MKGAKEFRNHDLIRLIDLDLSTFLIAVSKIILTAYIIINASFLNKLNINICNNYKYLYSILNLKKLYKNYFIVNHRYKTANLNFCI